jgi:hypothetical protein
LECWRDIEIRPERLQEWPEDGNLMDLDGVTRVEEAESESDPADPAAASDASNNDSQEQVTNLSNGELYHDGNDLGPAPLQANIAPEETFEGTESAATNADAQEQAAESERQLQELVSRLGGSSVARDNGGSSSNTRGASGHDAGGASGNDVGGALRHDNGGSLSDDGDALSDMVSVAVLAACGIVYSCA